MFNKSKLINLLVYSYIALPFIIFAAGFLKWQFALPFTLAIVASLFLAVHDSYGLITLKLDKYAPYKIAAGLVFIVAIVLMSGIGNIMWQNNDHATRNTIFDILTTYSWPPKAIVNDSEVSLVYYIGFWLPSALVGKFTSLDMGYIFSVVWTVAGLVILWYLLCVIHKKLVIYPLVIFLFFSGLDVVGHSLVNLFGDNLSNLQIGRWAFSQGSPISYHTEWWPKYFQYSSHMTQLFWVFNQCLPVWLATLLIIIEKSNKNLVFIMGLTLLSSTLPFVGLIPIFVWCSVTDHSASVLDRPFTPDPLKSFTSLFTVQNVIGGGVSGIMSFLYLRGNISSSSTASQTAASASSAQTYSLGVFLLVISIWIAVFVILSKAENWKLSSIWYILPSLPVAVLMALLPGYKLGYYLLFIALEFLIIALAVYPVFKQSSLYFLTVVSLLIVPFFIVGKSIDFCMRASIPLLVVLCLFAISALKEYVTTGKKVLAVILGVILITGAVTPIREIVRTVEATAYEISTKGAVQNDSKTIRQVFGGRNFTGTTEDNIFFEIFSK